MSITERPNGIAPLPLIGNKGNKGGAVARAWQEIWDQLSRTRFTDSVELANSVARKYGIKAISLQTHMHRMAAEGILEKERRRATVKVNRMATNAKGEKIPSTYDAHIPRTFYRIKAGS